jgi:ABC-type Zn2+ transport system substrate-binding protein/surface adhesin
MPEMYGVVAILILIMKSALEEGGEERRDGRSHQSGADDDDMEPAHRMIHHDCHHGSIQLSHWDVPSETYIVASTLYIQAEISASYIDFGIAKV